jgi:hypothetical protein
MVGIHITNLELECQSIWSDSLFVGALPITAACGNISVTGFLDKALIEGIEQTI